MAAAQAVTALLPVGWTAHRTAIAGLTAWPLLTPSATLAAYIGLTLAVAAYFWRDMAALAVGAGQIARGRREAEARLLLFMIVATLPLGIVGFTIVFLLQDARLSTLTSLTAIGWMSVGFGLLLYLSDRIGVTVRRISHMTWSSALVIGAVQILALVPGVGRCGVSVTIARLLGFERIEAARLTLLLSLPALLATIGLIAFKLAANATFQFGIDSVAAGLTAFAVGLLAIAGMMDWLTRKSFAPFALYRVIAGGALLGWIYFG
jgi:undecaprenyl-diphosphatase